MYGFIWRHLPGPTSVRVVLSLSLVTITGLLLWYVAFPWLDEWLPINEVTIGGGL